MLVFGNAPCVFEPFVVPPSIHDRVQCTPHVRERIYRRPMRELDYSVEEKEDRYVLSVRRPLRPGIMRHALEDRLSAFRELYEPSYDLVTDFLGNQYYVERRLTEQKLLREFMGSIDMGQLERQLAQETFRDYRVSLSADGCVLFIESQRDNVHKVVNLGKPFEDVWIEGFSLVSKDCVSMDVALKKMKPREAVKSKPIRVLPINITWRGAAQQQDSRGRSRSPKRVVGTHTTNAFQNKPLKETQEDDNEERVTQVQITRNTVQKEEESASTEKSPSIVLEEVEDEEVQKWKTSLSQVPKGYAILEDNNNDI